MSMRPVESPSRHLLLLILLVHPCLACLVCLFCFALLRFGASLAIRHHGRRLVAPRPRAGTPAGAPAIPGPRGTRRLGATLAVPLHAAPHLAGSHTRRRRRGEVLPG